jgi:hypothetical protein
VRHPAKAETLPDGGVMARRDGNVLGAALSPRIARLAAFPSPFLDPAFPFLYAMPIGN